MLNSVEIHGTHYFPPERCYPSYQELAPWLLEHDMHCPPDQQEDHCIRLVRIKRLAAGIFYNAQFVEDPQHLRPPAYEVRRSDCPDPSVVSLAAEFVSWWLNSKVLTEVSKAGDLAWRIQATWTDARLTPFCTDLDMADMSNDNLLFYLAQPPEGLNLSQRVEQLDGYLKQACDPNYQGPYGRTPLYFVSAKTQELAVRLIEWGARLTHYDVAGIRVLDHLYVEWGQVGIERENWGTLDLNRRNQEQLEIEAQLHAQAEEAEKAARIARMRQAAANLSN